MVEVGATRMLLSWSRRGGILGGSPKKENGVFFPSGSLVFKGLYKKLPCVNWL